MGPQRQPNQARPPGSACVWVVTVVLLLTVLTGGGCLVLYLTMPPADVPHWLPVAGLALVAFPWVFWTATCAYRCCCSSGAAATPGNMDRQPSSSAPVAPVPSSKSLKNARRAKHDRSPAGSPGGGRRVHFGDATVLGEEGGGALERDDSSSVNSHESEEALTYSMHSS